MDNSYFPIVIEHTGAHGLESGAVEGVDYFIYELITSPEELPCSSPFKIVATSVMIKKENT